MTTYLVLVAEVPGNVQWGDGKPLGRPLNELELEAISGARIVAMHLIPTNPATQEHLIDLKPDGWTIQHGWECRLAGQLFDCPYNAAAGTSGPAMRRKLDTFGPGRYVLALQRARGARGADHLTIGEKLGS